MQKLIKLPTNFFHTNITSRVQMILVAVMKQIVTKSLIEKQQTNYIMRSDHLFDIYLHVYVHFL